MNVYSSSPTVTYIVNLFTYTKNVILCFLVMLLLTCGELIYKAQNIFVKVTHSAVRHIDRM